MGSSKDFKHPAYDMLKKAISKTFVGSITKWGDIPLKGGEVVKGLYFTVPVAFVSGRETETFGFTASVSRGAVYGYVIVLARVGVSYDQSGKMRIKKWTLGAEDKKTYESIKRGMESKYPYLDITMDRGQLGMQWCRTTDGVTEDILCDELKTYTNLVFGFETALTQNSEGDDGPLLGLLTDYTSAGGFLYSDPLLKICEEGLRSIPNIRYSKTEDKCGFEFTSGDYPYAGDITKHDDGLHLHVTANGVYPEELVPVLNAKKIPYVLFGKDIAQATLVGQGIDKPEEVRDAVLMSLESVRKAVDLIVELTPKG